MINSCFGKIKFVLLLVFTLSACKNELMIESAEYENEVQYLVKLTDSLSVYIGMTKENRLKYFINRVDDNQMQFISFYNDGTIQSKEFLNFDKERHGYSCYFYKSDGNISGEYYYKNGNPIGLAIEYYSFIGRIKKQIIYDDSSQEVYKAEYNIEGEILSEEGDRLYDFGEK